MPVHGVGNLVERFDAASVVGRQPLWFAEAGLMDPQRLHDDESRATPCPRLVVRDVLICRQVIPTEIGRVRRHEDPVPNLDVADPRRLEAPRIPLTTIGIARRIHRRLEPSNLGDARPTPMTNLPFVVVSSKTAASSRSKVIADNRSMNLMASSDAER